MLVATMVKLSQRQQAVCELVAEGLSAKQIAAKLCISHRTVEDHRKEVYRKLGVRSAVGLVRKLILCNGA